MAGGSPVGLDQASTDQHGPSWSPDGNWIAYRRLLNGTWSTVKAPLGGGAIVRLDEGDPGRRHDRLVADWRLDRPLPAGRDAALTPDDSRIIVSSGINTSDIWLLERFEPPRSLLARYIRW